jgi:ubiquinone biosynthesis protein
MRLIRQFNRLRQLNRVILRHGLDDYFARSEARFMFKLARFFQPWHSNRYPEHSKEARLMLALQALGPIYVKLGQLLSTRRDLIPPAIADELARLQDKVQPFESALARRIIEQAFDTDIESLFSEFHEEPLASASIAQVHAATLSSGEKVVVKVIRPGIEKVIQRDIELMYTMARLLARLSTDGRRLRPVEVVADYEKTIYDELDLQREAANQALLRRNFAKSDKLYFPEVYWDYCHRNVMVSERIHGIPIGHIDELKAAGVDMKALAECGVEVFFTQVFRDNFFHADMHPGNIFVDATNPKKPTYIGIDCGIVGSLSRDDQRYLAENFVAFFNRDYRKVAQLHVDSGWVPPETSVEEFEGAIRTVCEPIFEKPLGEISYSQLLVRLFQTARRFNMEVQPQLVLLEKTLIYVEGLGRQLYPELDLWQTAKPYLERWLKEQVGLPSLVKALKENLPYWAEKLPEIPDLVYASLRMASREQRATEVRKAYPARHYLMGISGAFIIASALLLSLLGLGEQTALVSGALGAVGGALMMKGWPEA